MTDCGTVPCIFNVISGPSLWIIIAISVVLGGFAALYRYREALRGKPAYVYIGLVTVILFIGALFAGFAFIKMSNDRADIDSYHAGVSINQNPGVVEITIIDASNLNSMGIVGPDRTRSTMADFEPGTVFRLRSNEKVISYLNSPENNITVLTTSGTKTVESVSELPSEYQRAPHGFINPDADIGNYANASVATVACLYDSATEFELGGRRVPAEASVPCNTPVLAQDDSVTVGTSVKPTSGPNAGKTLTSPITLRNGEYSFVGTIEGSENVIQTFTIADEVLREQDESNESS